MNSCGSWAWFNKQTKEYRPFYCGSGNCDRQKCRVMFWSQRVRLITALIAEYGLIRFFTLTLDPKYLCGDSWSYIHIPWSRMRKRLNRRFSNFKFVAILESHKYRDVPHIHGFTNVWLRVEEWSEMWNECKGGKIVWVEKVRNENASQYVSKQIEVAKYVSKDTIKASYGEEKRYRTLWRSQKTKAKFELTKGDVWCILKEDVFVNGVLSNFHAKKGIWSND